jgi:hypothetical protein
MKGFFMDQDQLGQWHVVDSLRRKEWEEWKALPEDVQKTWEAPIYAIRLTCPPSHIEFPSFKQSRK